MVDVDNEEAMHVWRQGVYRKSLYFPLNFAMNLKLLFKKKYLEKSTCESISYQEEKLHETLHK